MKIKQLEIENFRGITLRQSISFEKDNKACSIVIFGDNGSGKSSMIDALELGLQGRLYKTIYYNESEFVPQVQSVPKPQYAEIKIVLENDSSILIQGNEITTKRPPHTNFTQAPIVLRRRDITVFWETTAKERLRHFYDYLPDEEVGLTNPIKSEIDTIKQKQELKKQERNDLLTTICNKVNLSFAKIPLDTKPFELFRATFKNENPTLYHKVKSLFDELTKISSDIREFTKAIKAIKNPAQRQFYKEKLNQIFVHSDWSKSLSDDFLFLSESMISIVEKIEVLNSHPAELDFLVTLKDINSPKLPPQKFFSEANLSLLAILIYLNVIKDAAQRGQARVLILDDIFQSIDANIRGKVVDYLMENFKDWQLIFTVHDNLWRERLTNKLALHNYPFLEYEIKNWNLANGPTINISHSSRCEILKKYVDEGTTQEICSYAGITLEYILEEISYITKLKMPRERNNHYFIKDYVEALNQVEGFNVLINKIKETLPIRNLVGAHYHEWTQSLTHLEAKVFGEDVLTFYKSLFCMTCKSWVKFEKILIRRNYEITSEICAKLLTQGIPEKITRKLNDLKGENEFVFLEKLKERLKAQYLLYHLIIFKAAQYEDSYKPSYKCNCGKNIIA